MSTHRILVTGSRKWVDQAKILSALREAQQRYPGAILVHGDAVGADKMAATVWETGSNPTEPHPASNFPTPRARNQHMVDLGADLCLAFALSWASGTGMCARMARRAGIETIDYGVNTDTKPREGDRHPDMPMRRWCNACDDYTWGGSHYHCANCGEPSGMMGHWRIEGFTCTPKTRKD